MSVKEVDNANTTKAKATRGSVYTIHTNKYIEHLPNNPTTTSMSDRQVWKCTNTSGRNRVLEKASKRTFYHRKHRVETRFWRLLANYERDSKYYQKVFLSLSDSFCFVYLYFVNFWGGFLFSILVEIHDIYVE